MNYARRFGFLFCIALFSTACDDDGGSDPGFQVQIDASQPEGNAPFAVTLSPRVGGPLDNIYTYAWDFGDGATSTMEAPDHVFQDAGEFTVTLAVTEAGGASVSATLPIVVLPSANLAVSGVTASPRQVRSGDTVNVVWALENTAEPTASPSTVTVFLSEDETFGASDIILDQQPLAAGFSGAPVGQETDVVLPDDLMSGDYQVGVVVDPDGAVGDADRGNNVAFASVPLAVRNPQETGADLVICGLDVPAFNGLEAGESPVIQLGDQLDVQICLSNIGDRPAALGGYAVYLSTDEVFDPSDAPVGVRAGVALGSGDRETFADLVDIDPSLSAGRYFLLAVADPDELVEEQLEDNNVRAYAVPINLAEPGEVSGVDLVLRSLAVEGERAFWDQTLEGTVALQNRGDADVVRPFVVRIEAVPVADGQSVQVGSLNVGGLASGEESMLTIPVRITRRVEEGDYRLTAVADPTNGVGDVNPGNNRRTLQTVLTLGGEPDLDPAVDAVTFEPTRIDAGGQVVVQITLTNVGRDSTGQVNGLVILSEDAVVGPDAVVLDQFSVPDLAPGMAVPLERQVIIPVDVDQNVVQWRLGVVLDPDDRVVNEGSEANNVLFAPRVLTVDGATGGCAEDAENEPNDRPENAALIAPGDYEGLGACDDADWFVVDVPAGGVLAVNLEWDAAEGLATLDLADTEGEIVQPGQQLAVGQLGLFTVPSEAPATYLLRVTGGGARLQYDLSVAVTPAAEGVDLRVTAVESSPGTVGAGAPVSISFDAVNVGADAAAASEAEVRLAADPQGETGPGGGAPVVLGTVMVPALTGGELARLRADVVVPEATPDGQYFAVVSIDSTNVVEEADEANNLGAGRLRVDAEDSCAADALEPNVSPLEEGGAAAQAGDLEPGSYPDLNACRGDDDWYAVTLAQGERLEASATFVHVDGDLEMELYAPDASTLLDESRSLQNQESVRLIRADVAGTYYLRVFLAGDAPGSNTYQLDVEVRGADACQDDDQEPNDDGEGARILRDGNYDLVLCPGDGDWFRFAIAAGTSVSFSIDPGRAGINLTLFDPEGNQVGQADNRIFHQAEVTGQYRLLIESDDAERRLYALTVGGVSGIDLTLADLRVAPEFTAPGAEVRATGSLQNLRGDLAQNVGVRFYLSRTTPLAEDALVLGDLTVDEVEGAGTTSIRKKLTLPLAVEGGDWHLVAVVDPDTEQPDIRRANNEISVPFTVQDACVDDDARENEGPLTATDLAEAMSPVDAAVICAFTEDWYALPVLASGPVDIGIDFDHDVGDLDLRVYADDGVTLLGESAGEADGESVQIMIEEGDAPTTLLIRVDGFFDAENTYSLSWSL
ncbi:MAG: CARDB domain-containing protein [Bradymonadia bacterium]